MRLELPWPPTTNNLYANVRGHRVLSKEGRAYHQSVGACVLVARANVRLSGRLTVMLELHAPSHTATGKRRSQRYDVGNREKVLIDALTAAGVWQDDSQIDDLRIVRREPVSGGKVVVTIEERA